MPPTFLDDFHRDGFAVVRDLLTPFEIQQVGNAFNRLLARAQRLERTTDIHGTRFVVDQDPFRLRRVVWAGGVEPTLAALGGDRRFLAVVGATLQSSQCVQLIQQAHFKIPGDGVNFRYHQDASNRRYGSDLWSDVDGRGSFVQLALAVDPMHAHNGPLRVLPGTHLQGFVADPLTGDLPPDAFDVAHAIDLSLNPGDLAVFGPFLIHGSPANTGDSPRRLFLQGYAAPGANRRVYPGSGTGVLRAIE